jgi:hypothetical protein
LPTCQSRESFSVLDEFVRESAKPIMKLNQTNGKYANANDLKKIKAEFMMPNFSPIRTNSLTDTPEMDFKETTKKLDFTQM